MGDVEGICSDLVAGGPRPSQHHSVEPRVATLSSRTRDVCSGYCTALSTNTAGVFRGYGQDCDTILCRIRHGRQYKKAKQCDRERAESLKQLRLAVLDVLSLSC